MATQTRLVLVDDLDGGPASTTVEFGLDRHRYAIDLSAENAARLREVLGEYIGAARVRHDGPGAALRRPTLRRSPPSPASAAAPVQPRPRAPARAGTGGPVRPAPSRVGEIAEIVGDLAGDLLRAVLEVLLAVLDALRDQLRAASGNSPRRLP